MIVNTKTLFVILPWITPLKPVLMKADKVNHMRWACKGRQVSIHTLRIVLLSRHVLLLRYFCFFYMTRCQFNQFH